MIINRNGMEIELTAEELCKAYNEYELMCRIEDVISVIAQEDYTDRFSEEDLNNTELMREIADRISYTLSDWDSYWEIYWDAVSETIIEYLNEHPKEM